MNCLFSPLSFRLSKVTNAIELLNCAVVDSKECEEFVQKTDLVQLQTEFPWALQMKVDKVVSYKGITGQTSLSYLAQWKATSHTSVGRPGTDALRITMCPTLVSYSLVVAVGKKLTATVHPNQVTQIRQKW